MKQPSMMELAESLIERTSDDAVETRASGGKPKDKGGLNPVFAFVLPVAANSFDAYSTTKALKRGGKEANSVLEPFADNELALYGTKIGTGLLAGLLADRLAKSGHRTAAKVLGSINIALPLGAGISNMQKAK